MRKATTYTWNGMPKKIKTDCPKCGGRSKITTKIVYVKGDCELWSRPCYKCGFQPVQGQGPVRSGRRETFEPPEADISWAA